MKMNSVWQLDFFQNNVFIFKYYHESNLNIAFEKNILQNINVQK